jgi:hypothetical protein
VSIRLLSLVLPELKPRGLATTREILLDQPTDATLGWTVHIRGPAVFLLSPPGWRANVPRDLWDPKGERQAFEFPRSACCERWSVSGVDDLDKVQKYDSPVLTRAGAQEAA